MDKEISRINEWERNNMKEKNIWGFHNPIEHEENLIKNNCISMAWKELDDLSKIKPNTKDGFQQKYIKYHPNDPIRSVSQCVGQLYRFVYEANIGDYVVFPTKYNRMINIGEIIGEYTYDEKEEHYVNKRKVKWIKHIPRTEFSQGALYEMGSFLTFFRIKNYADEILNIIENKKSKTESEQDDSVAITSEAIIDSTKDYVLKALSTYYKGYDLEVVVSDLLNAMGYRTKISSHGGDRGKDIVAYKDELPPRIVVQVKSQDGDIAESTVQSLKGAMREGDYGLFVTLSDYTKNARKFLESQPIIKALNGSDLVDLILKYYDDMPDSFRDKVKLKRVFIPIIDINDEL